jgi:hypothetical protein
MKSKLPTIRKEFQFEQATVVYTAEHLAAAGIVMPMLSVQVLDQYGYQRELTVHLCHTGGDSETLDWDVHTYRHPGRRYIQQVSTAVAERFIERFLEICEKFPIFLFNSADNSGSPRSKGFVQLSEQLLDGAKCSVRLLK